MTGWWIFMGCLTAAGVTLASTRHRQRRARRVRLDLIRGQIEAWLSAPQPPVDGLSFTFPSSAGPQQPGDSPEPPTGEVTRPRRRVALSDPSLSATLAPGWRLS